MTTTALRRKSIPKSSTRLQKKRRVGRPRSGKISITTTIRPDLKDFAAQLGTRTTATGKAVGDVSAGIERALEFYREHHAESKEAVDANGWPVGFFDEVIGKWAGRPLVREPQGEYEIRDEL